MSKKVVAERVKAGCGEGRGKGEEVDSCVDELTALRCIKVKWNIEDGRHAFNTSQKRLMDLMPHLTERDSGTCVPNLFPPGFPSAIHGGGRPRPCRKAKVPRGPGATTTTPSRVPTSHATRSGLGRSRGWRHGRAPAFPLHSLPSSGLLHIYTSAEQAAKAPNPPPPPSPFPHSPHRSPSPARNRVMSHKRPLEAIAPEQLQEAARSPTPRKRLRRTVLVMTCLERIRRARAVTLQQMVRQAQLDMAKLFFLVMVIVARLGSIEGLLLKLPNMLRGLWADQFDNFHSSIVGTIQDTIRSVLRTETEERQPASLPNGVCETSRKSKGLIQTGGISGVFKLRFVGAARPKDTLYTGYPVKWQDGENAKVAIFRNEKQIMNGDLSKLQIEILPVHADFFTEQGQENFTKEEFDKQIYSHKGKESVLTTVNLANGEACLGSFFFRESSYGKKLRLTARVKRQDPAVRVQEAITDPFVVKHHRSESNAKNQFPSKEDEVHRLKKISPKGKRRDALVGKKITKVKHLLRQYHKDKSDLQKLTGMKKEDWLTMIKHATMCDPGDEIYSYRVAEKNYELLFNDFFDLVGMMNNGDYVPVSDLAQFQQLNKWKISAYKRFEERENSGDLIPDYWRSNGLPVHAVPLNNDAGPSVQARMPCQYLNDMGAQHELGEQHPFRQQNVFSPAEVLSTNDASSSKQEAPLFSQHTTHQDLGQHGPSMLQNGTPCYPTQGSFSGQPTIPSHIVLPVPKDDFIGSGSLTGQQNGSLSSLMTDAPGTSCLVTDGVSQGTTSLNHDEADNLSDLIEALLGEEAPGADQDFIPANNGMLFLTYDDSFC
uniref:Uncharacterized protein n=1 Tax=Avena sativa TaxID=4498 RepID=A0ACD5WFD4_AVESA